MLRWVRGSRMAITEGPLDRRKREVALFLLFMSHVQPRSQSSRGSRSIIPGKNIGSNKCTGTSVCRKPEVEILVPVHELSPDFC